MNVRSRLGSLVVMSCLLAFGAGAARAQTQIKPRVMLMVDTSGSMSERMNNGTDLNGDHSLSYSDPIMTRSQAATPGQQLYPGNAVANACTTSATYQTNPADMSRMFNAKAAVTNVINGSGDVEWGLMRYSGSSCPFATVATAAALATDRCNADSDCVSGDCDEAVRRCRCNDNGDCASGDCGNNNFCDCDNNNECGGGGYVCNNVSGDADRCDCTAGNCPGGACVNGIQCVGRTCATDFDCPNRSFCVTGTCQSNPNLCYWSNRYDGDECNGRFTGLISYRGSCGTSAAAATVACASEQVCYADSDCGGTLVGRCALIGIGPARSCLSNGTTATCPTNYTAGTGGSAGRCVYNLGCRSTSGVILVDPATLSFSSLQVLPYADNIENFTDGGSGQPVNPELRADGNTPLAGAARSATTWYNAIKTYTQANPLCNEATEPLCDRQLSCRPYVLVQLTDGDDTCDDTNGGSQSAGVIAGAEGFVAATVAGARVPNKVYVIGLSFTNGSTLDGIAYKGGTTTARLANSQAQIESALADIVASSVLVEQCNGADDNCNNVVDEGLGVYEECNPALASTCMVGGCANSGANQGRCTCTGGLPNQCNTGYACNAPSGAGFCVPTCSVGQGICQQSGVRKCGGNCCVNDGLVACTALVEGTPLPSESCNNLDDNCNGQIDEGNVCSVCQPTVETCNGRDDDCMSGIDNNLVDTGLPCGSDEGECQLGTTACEAVSPNVFPHASDRIVCLGGVGPVPETCDGKDNNCDGVVDGMTRGCYSGAPTSRGVGVCRDGAQACTAVLGSGMENWGTCTGEILPTVEVCNGVDDNCDGLNDNVAGTGGACCSSGKCGMGLCVAGILQCSGGGIQCVGEIGPAQEVCDGLDNDCNGLVDDVPGLGASCTPPGSSCGGGFACNISTHVLDCVAAAAAPEVCNGVDDDCDGTIDDAPDITTNDTRLNQACDVPMAPANLPPCLAGNTVCLNGQVACTGSVTPEPNVCGQASRDCQTSGVFNGNCPAGFECLEGTCAAPCAGGEFPCPGGFVCKESTTGGTRLCVPDACSKLSCPMGQFCQLDPQGMAVCVDPCASVSCPSGYRCNEGLCVDDSCKTFGCPDGQACIGTTCQSDPCFNKFCDANQYCSPATGECVLACVGPCPNGEQCVDGLCSSDPCAGKKCASGETCSVAQGVGVCVADACTGVGCNPGATCCAGVCIADPCSEIGCPGGSLCQVNSLCAPFCIAEATEKIVGAGGGGFACDVASVGAEGRRGGTWMLLLLGASLLVTRRRRQVA